MLSKRIEKLRIFLSCIFEINIGEIFDVQIFSEIQIPINLMLGSILKKLSMAYLYKKSVVNTAKIIHDISSI